MKPTPLDGYTLGRIVSDLPVNGEIQAVSGRFKPLAEYLNGLAAEARPGAFQEGCAALGSDGADLNRFVQEAAPDGPPPEIVGTPARPANLSDLRKLMSDSRWVWEGWIPASRISGIAAFEGVGKTRLAMDLARRIWSGLPWPDGQAATFPERTPTLWVCSDGQQDDLVGIAAGYGLPDEALNFNALPEDPYGGNDLDDPECLVQLEEFIGLARPGLVFIDSLTYATGKDLSQANHVQSLMTPIRDIARRTQTAIVPLLHVSKDGQALGRRIKGITRVILQLDCPDPDRSARLRLSVPKSFDKKPPPLGVTMGDSGNDYDPNPPAVAEPNQGGRPPEKREKAKAFIRERLALANDRPGVELRAEWVQSGECGKTFGNAVKEMESAGELTASGGTGKGKQWTLHLVGIDPAPAF